MIAVRALMNPATQAAQAELRLGLRRAIRAVRVHIRRRVGLVQKSIELLAVMHTRVGHVILPDQLVLGIRIHVILVAVEALAVLLGPARILVFLPVFRRVLLPRLGRLAGLHVIILVAAIALLGNRHDRGIDHLAAARNVALRLQMLAKALEQLLNQTGLRKRLSEQPQRRAVRNAVLDAEPQKPRERQPVAHLVLDLFVRQIVKRLQHQHPKHHQDVDRLAASGALLLPRRRQHCRLDLSPKALERHHASNHFQRIALYRNRRKPPVRIEKSELPHRPHTANHVVTSQTRTNFAEVAIFRGALNNDLAHAAFGFGWQMGLSDAPRFPICMTVDKEAIDFVQRYFAVSCDISRKLDIATARLNLARRRNVIADQAIDGSICLEALLGDDRFDLTYKLALRAALLVGQGIDDRLKIMETIKRFYRVRSAAVHGSEQTITPKLI